MANKARDVVGFRRIFVLFCTLVLLPAMLMSGFVVAAMRNERNAQKLAEREKADRLLVAAEGALLKTLEETEAAAKGRMSTPGVDPREVLDRLREAGLPVGPAAYFDHEGVPRHAEGPFTASDAGLLLERIQRVVARETGATGAHLETDTPQPGVLNVLRLADGRVLAYYVDDERMRERMRRALPEAEAPLVLLSFEGKKTPAEVNAVERLLGELTRGTDAVATRRLAAPFERYSLRVESDAGSPGRILFIYIALLLVFYGTLITGVVIISRLVWQESRLSRLKTDFVSHVSHELRTPLTSIRMFIETLKLGRASPEEQEECIELLAQETERLSEMIERVLGYARLRSGRREFSLKEVDMATAIDEAVNAFRAHLVGAEAEVDVTVEVEPGLPAVLADRDGLVEALLNLVGNAFKYTGADKRIRLFARVVKKRVLVGVADNGPGLPKSEHKRVFERFYQARSLLSQPNQGSGLGLAITKGIIEGMGGRISVDSEPGRGATFLIELPVAEAERAAA
jgi:signal transduction histidine kinase